MLIFEIKLADESLEGVLFWAFDYDRELARKFGEFVRKGSKVEVKVDGGSLYVEEGKAVFKFEDGVKGRLLRILLTVRSEGWVKLKMLEVL